MTPNGPPAPTHLSKPSREVWRAVARGWELDPAGWLVLRAGLEQWETYQRAREELAKAATVTVTSSGTGVPRAHPAAKVAVDSLREARLCFAQLGLELPDPAVPARRKGRNHG
ncbi:MAG: P27 family phage terminase small subunit [Gemmatimonadales bacterium]